MEIEFSIRFIFFLLDSIFKYAHDEAQVPSLPPSSNVNSRN